jgi:predicted nucleic acid-binding protein
VSVLLDTGPLVALLNRRDTHYAWMVEQSARLKPPFYSCEGVIAEAHHLLTRHPAGGRRLNQLVRSGKIDLSFSYADHVDEVHRLMEKYENVPMSFADACVVRLAEVHRRSRVLTIDSDFRIYRKHRDRPLDLITP